MHNFIFKRLEKELTIIDTFTGEIVAETAKYDITANHNFILNSSAVLANCDAMKVSKQLVKIENPHLEGECENTKKALKRLGMYVSYLGFLKNKSKGKKRISKLSEIRTSCQIQGNIYKYIKQFSEKVGDLFIFENDCIYVNPRYVTNTPKIASLPNLIRFNAYDIVYKPEVALYVFISTNKQVLEREPVEIIENVSIEEVKSSMVEYFLNKVEKNKKKLKKMIFNRYDCHFSKSKISKIIIGAIENFSIYQERYYTNHFTV